MGVRLLPTAALIAALGCGSSQARQPLVAGLPLPTDEPYDYSDRDDVDRARELFDSLEDGDERESIRLELTRAYLDHARKTLARREWQETQTTLNSLLGLWRHDEISDGSAKRDLAHATKLFRSLRDFFAKAGLSDETVGVLYVLATIDPASSSRYLHEVDEILDYLDHLNRAEFGDGAERARPIKALARVAETFPARAAADRLLELYIARQRALNKLLRSHGTNIDLVRAHGSDVLHTCRYVVALAAKTGRLHDVPDILAKLDGIGDDQNLRMLLRHALSRRASIDGWMNLAKAFQGGDNAKLEDSDASLAIIEEGLQRFPDSVDLLSEAGNIAFNQRRIYLAIRYFERAVKLGATTRNTLERLAALYETQIGILALHARVGEATAQLDRFTRFYRRMASRVGVDLRPDVADAYAAMGQGLVTLGELERAQHYLEESIDSRATLTALEYRGLIAFKHRRGDHGQRAFERATELPLNGDGEHFQRNRLLRLAGEAALANGDKTTATKHFRGAVTSWSRVIDTYQLNAELIAELMLETARLYWILGNREAAADAFDAAIEANSDSEYFVAEAVVFLLAHEARGSALDIFHRALPNPNISDDIKIYMALWLVADQLYFDVAPDPFVAEVVQSGRGSPWAKQLASLAFGSAAASDLAPFATTTRKQTELVFYSALLQEAARSPDKATRYLEKVRSSNMILDYEFTLAGSWIERLSRD